MLHETRTLAPTALDARHVAVEIRTPWLRVGLHRARNVASDYSLLAQASPFAAPHPRSGLTLVIEGQGRFDEAGRTAWLEPGDLVQSEHARQGTEAHAGAASRVLLLEWDHRHATRPMSGRFETTRLDARTRARLAVLLERFERDASAALTVEILDLLRALGVPLERLARADLEHDAPAATHRSLASAVARSLSRVDRFPSIDDVEDEVSMNQRTLNRHLRAMAERYALTWAHWRSALHQTRVLTALRLLAAPGATTELVARLAGFRSPSALCHTFALAGLPSPGVLAREARRDPLAAWSEHVVRASADAAAE